MQKPCNPDGDKPNIEKRTDSNIPQEDKITVKNLPGDTQNVIHKYLNENEIEKLRQGGKGYDVEGKKITLNKDVDDRRIFNQANYDFIRKQVPQVQLEKLIPTEYKKNKINYLRAILGKKFVTKIFTKYFDLKKARGNQKSLFYLTHLLKNENVTLFKTIQKEEDYYKFNMKGPRKEFGKNLVYILDNSKFTLKIKLLILANASKLFSSEMSYPDMERMLYEMSTYQNITPKYIFTISKVFSSKVAGVGLSGKLTRQMTIRKLNVFKIEKIIAISKLFKEDSFLQVRIIDALNRSTLKEADQIEKFAKENSGLDDSDLLKKIESLEVKYGSGSDQGFCTKF